MLKRHANDIAHFTRSMDNRSVYQITVAKHQLAWLRHQYHSCLAWANHCIKFLSLFVLLASWFSSSEAATLLLLLLWLDGIDTNCEHDSYHDPQDINICQTRGLLKWSIMSASSHIQLLQCCHHLEQRWPPNSIQSTKNWSITGSESAHKRESNC